MMLSDAALFDAFDTLTCEPLVMDTDVDRYNKVRVLLGGPERLMHPLATEMDVHEMLVAGLPGETLTYLVDNLAVRDRPSVEKAIGVSLRTLQRLRGTDKTLSQEQSSRTWKFAETLAQAIDVFGTQPEAERWLEQPAIGLDQRRPLDLLATTKGTEIVQTFLDRIRHGVYT